MSSKVDPSNLIFTAENRKPTTYRNIFRPLNSIKDFESLSKNDQAKYFFGALFFLLSIFGFFFYALSLSYESGKSRRNPNPTGVILRMTIIIGMFVTGVLLMASAVGMMGGNENSIKFDKKISGLRSKYDKQRFQDMRYNATLSYGAEDGLKLTDASHKTNVSTQDMNKFKIGHIEQNGEKLTLETYKKTGQAASPIGDDKYTFGQGISPYDCVNYFSNLNESLDNNNKYNIFYWLSDARTGGHCTGFKQAAVSKGPITVSPGYADFKAIQYVGCVQKGARLDKGCALVS